MVREDLEKVLVALQDPTVQPHIANACLITLPGTESPWRDTGIALERGDEITVLAAGQVILSDELDLRFGPITHLWRRIGRDGPVFKAATADATHRAEQAGRFYLGILTGAWLDPTGAYDGGLPLAGEMVAVLIHWRGDAGAGFEALERVANHPAVRAAAASYRHPHALPSGWQPLWRIGDTDVFEGAHHGAGVRAHPRDGLGIVCRRVETPLTAETRLRWRWRFDRLPSQQAENQFPTHDYISIAVEFENGQDLTYCWSAALPAGFAYRCPLPGWDQRETHMVIRSGSDALGQWQLEDRALQQDYVSAVGPTPQRIVSVWLIAVSIFTHSEGDAEFADIELVQPDGIIPISGQRDFR